MSDRSELWLRVCAGLRVLGELPGAYERAEAFMAGPGGSGVRGPKGGHSSPTERVALGADEFAGLVGRMDAQLVVLDGALKALRELVAVSRPVGGVDDQEVLWCLSHGRVGVHEPVRKGERLCDWCSSFKVSEGRLPPPQVLERRAQGHRITVQEIARWKGDSA